MDNAIKKMIQRNYIPISTMTECLAFVTIYLVGICRYRIVLIIVAILIVQLLFEIAGNNNKIIRFISVPVLLLTLYIDYIKGPLAHYPLEYSVLLSLIIGYVVVLSFDMISSYLVVKITDHSIFKLCGACGYENKKLVDKCDNCKQSHSGNSDYGTAKINDNSKYNTNSESCELAKQGLIDKLSDKVISMITIDTDEMIVLNMKLSTLRSFNKNGDKIRLALVILTSKKIILLDYRFYNSGWTYREYIPLESICNINISAKKINTVMMPVLTIHTKNNDVYELYYNPLPSSEIKLKHISNAIETNLTTRISIACD